MLASYAFMNNRWPKVSLMLSAFCKGLGTFGPLAQFWAEKLFTFLLGTNFWVAIAEPNFYIEKYFPS